MKTATCVLVSLILTAWKGIRSKFPGFFFRAVRQAGLAWRMPSVDERGVTGGDIKRALDEAGVIPSRKLGQNFLCDPNMARAIVEDMELPEGATVVEVGPGTGALTEHLPGRTRRTILVEYDARLAAALKERFRGEEDVEVHDADAARFDTRRLFRHRPVHLLGNLPYSSGGAILRNFLDPPSPCDGAVLMLQREVVERMMARPRTKEYGMLTLVVRNHWDIEIVRRVPPEAFWPRPQVESTVIRLRPRREPLPVHDFRLFTSLVKRGFAQRRKQMRKQMPAEPPWEEVAERIGVAPTARAEELGLEQWVQLSRIYDRNPLGQDAQRDDEVFDVVDAEDRVTGQATRAEVHSKGLMHRAVHVLVFNRKGDLFLQRRSRLKDVHPGLWDTSAAGHLDTGEDYPEAAARELEEELGISGAAPVEIGRIAACLATGNEHVRVFRVEHPGKVRWPCGEIEVGVWMPPGEVDAWTHARPGDFAGGFLKCWELFRGQVGGEAG
jgi:16S rRNA (adenine1518-N6/adenine1519-N6)-dimethyltransferase